MRRRVVDLVIDLEVPDEFKSRLVDREVNTPRGGKSFCDAGNQPSLYFTSRAKGRRQPLGSIPNDSQGSGSDPTLNYRECLSLSVRGAQGNLISLGM